MSVSSGSSSSSSSNRGTPGLSLNLTVNTNISPVHGLPTGASLPLDSPAALHRKSSSASAASGMSSNHARNHLHSHHHLSSSPPSSASLRNGAHLFNNMSAQFTGFNSHRHPSLSSAVADGPATAATTPFFPPHHEIVAGCRVFVSSYFQLGFLPKAIFIESVSCNLNSISPFLLSAILSIAARFTPCLVRRYGNSTRRATDNFLEIARAMALTEMYKPTLDRTQAFFLLAIAEWGDGEKDRSSLDMGVAVRMASILRLHREETYALPAHASAEQVIRAESARRTFWMIHSQENLQAGYSSPAPFPPEDITARLPCDEHAFAFGVPAVARSVLQGTASALQQQQALSASSPTTDPSANASPPPPPLTSTNQCLFATLIQTHTLWGHVARRACRADLKASRAALTTAPLPPWDPESEYHVLVQQLREFEAGLPERHQWSLWNLRGWCDEQMHLAYLGMVMVLRVSNVVERRIYLDEILYSVTNPTGTSSPSAAGLSPGSRSDKDRHAPEDFWNTMSNELFSNVLELYEQIDAFHTIMHQKTKNSNSDEATGEGFPAILVFCIYICGSLAAYLWRYPQLCPRVANRAEEMSLRCLQVLAELHKAWPTSRRWNQGLQQYAGPLASAAAAAAAAASSSSSAGGLARHGNGNGLSGSPMSATSGSEDNGNSPPTPTPAYMDIDPLDIGLGHEALDDAVIDPRLSSISAGLSSSTQAQTPAKMQGGGGASGPFWKMNGDMFSGVGAPSSTVSDADAAFPSDLLDAEMSTLLAVEPDFGWLDFERAEA